MTHLNLTAALYRAEADLCTNTANRVKVYEMLVEALAPLEKLLERQGAAGRVPQGEVDQGKLVRLDAQIDLERLRLGQSASQPWLRERYERRQ
jgi:hypothetical protein